MYWLIAGVYVHFSQLGVVVAVVVLVVHPELGRDISSNGGTQRKNIIESKLITYPNYNLLWCTLRKLELYRYAGCLNE